MASGDDDYEAWLRDQLRKANRVMWGGDPGWLKRDLPLAAPTAPSTAPIDDGLGDDAWMSPPTPEMLELTRLANEGLGIAMGRLNGPADAIDPLRRVLGIEDLPDELLEQVLGFVDRFTIILAVPLVCRHWRLTCAHIAHVVLDLRWSPRMLRHRVDQDKLTDTALAAMCFRFQGFSEAFFPAAASQLTDRAVAAVVAKGARLTRLHLTGCGFVTDSALAAVGTCCPALIQLDLERCRNFSSRGLAEVWRGCTVLESLNLFGCDGLTSAALAGVAQCPRLASLGLGRCLGLDSTALEWVGRGCPALVHLDISLNQGIGNTGIVAIANGCPGLTSIAMAHLPLLTDAGLMALAHRCTLLRTVTMPKCTEVSTIGVGALGARCTALESADFGGCYIGSAALAMFGRHCRALRVLSLRRCRSLDRFGLSEVAQCALLESLNMEGCESTTDAGLGLVARGCPKLARLFLAHCHQVTDQGLGSVGNFCRNLQQLKLEYCVSVTDIGLDALKGCQRLEELDIGGCTLVTDAGVKRLRRQCPRLEWLER